MAISWVGGRDNGWAGRRADPACRTKKENMAGKRRNFFSRVRSSSVDGNARRRRSVPNPVAFPFLGPAVGVHGAHSLVGPYLVVLCKFFEKLSSYI